MSAGGVVYRRTDDVIEIVLAARRTRRGDLAWGLAKGGIEADESAEQAAVREVREETGIEAEIEASLGETRYFYVWENVRIRKTVHFFLMRHRRRSGRAGRRDGRRAVVPAGAGVEASGLSWRARGPRSRGRAPPLIATVPGREDRSRYDEAPP